MLSQPPEEEYKFSLLKEKYGSTYAFHGSPPENWHSILRNGLKNASGTKYQMHGAAYGKGIYLATHSSTSMGYVGMGSGETNKKTDKSNERFLNSSNITCLTICEVVDHSIKKTGGIWVATDEDTVCTRFLMVYPSGTSIPQISAEKITTEIKNAIEFYQL